MSHIARTGFLLNDETSVLFQIHHVTESSDGLKSFTTASADHEPFPTLQRALQELDPHLAFNIEVRRQKYSRLRRDHTIKFTDQVGLRAV